MEDYLKAKKAGDRTLRKAVIHGEYPYVRSLDEMISENDLAGSVYVGTLDIPLAQIAGTKTAARQNAFASDFMPIAGPDTEFAMKWTSLLKSQMEEGLRDPVQVYEYRHLFYVQEGNKRVSVMKYLDAIMIRASVTRLLPKEKDEAYEEFLCFFKVSGMYDISFSKAGSYRKLCRMLNLSMDQPWDEMDMRRLRGIFHNFKTVYEKRYADPAYISPSDAFLKYLAAYSSDSLRLSAEKIMPRLTAMADEFAVSLQESPAEIIDRPSETKEPVIDIRKIVPLIPEKPLRIAFIYDADPQSSMAVFEHELGRIMIDSRFRNKVATYVYENCSEPSSLRLALQDASEKADAVITVSPSHYAETYRQAVRMPGCRFLNCSMHRSDASVRTYAVRTYEASFLMGALAAVFGENHQLAYIAGYPEFGTVAEINAFAIGASLIDPEARVYLGWKDTLDQDWQDQMRRLNIRVFASTDMKEFKENATEAGLFKLTAEGPVNLAVPVINWANYYEKLIQSMISGTYGGKKDKAVSYWWGMSSQVLDVNVSGSLPYSSRKLISLLKEALKAGKLNPFDGELHSTEKMIKGPYDPVLSNEEIMTMNWLNDNIIGIIPGYAQLTDSGKKKAEESGAAV